MTTPDATLGQFLTAFPGIFKAEVLKPELKEPNDAIMAQKMTKGRREALLESILEEKLKNNTKKFFFPSTGRFLPLLLYDFFRKKQHPTRLFRVIQYMI